MNNEKIFRAYGKINLGLDVIRKREDGYHEVKMIMQSVRLYDTLQIRRSREPGVRLTTNRAYLPVGPENLVCRAASLLLNEFAPEEGLEIDLRKQIPVAAGMAGGSSDAAATLVGINNMLRLGLSQEQLMERGVKLGADIPYCIMRGTALSEGIGEKLTPLAPMPDCYILLAKPPISVSTKFVYGNLNAAGLTEHPDIDGMAQALKDGSLAGITSRMGNVLETVTVPAYPVIDKIKKVMMDNGAEGALMSGSGPTVFGIFKKKELAGRAGTAVFRKGLARQIHVVAPFNTQRG